MNSSGNVRFNDEWLHSCWIIQSYGMKLMIYDYSLLLKSLDILDGRSSVHLMDPEISLCGAQLGEKWKLPYMSVCLYFAPWVFSFMNYINF